MVLLTGSWRTIFTGFFLFLIACDQDHPDSTSSLDAIIEITQENGEEITVNAQFTNEKDWYDNHIILEKDAAVFVSNWGFLRDFRAEGDAFDAYDEFSEEFVKLDRKSGTNTPAPFWSDLREDHFLFTKRLPADSSTDYYTVALLRDWSHSADESEVTLPEAFSISSPTQESLLSRSNDDILIEWDTAESHITEVMVHLLVNCGGNISEQYLETSDQDIGWTLIPAGTLSQNAALSGTCATRATVAKQNSGSLDGEFKGGSINGFQVRTVNFSTAD